MATTPLAKKLGCELDRADRVKVNPDLSLPGHPEIFAIGDRALVLKTDGKPVPGVSPAAMQMGAHAAKLIEAELESSAATGARPAFKYWDKGTMATIGRSAAVAQVGKIKLSGYPAWLAWLFVHLIFLVGFRNRTAVLFQWALHRNDLTGSDRDRPCGLIFWLDFVGFGWIRLDSVFGFDSL